MIITSQEHQGHERSEEMEPLLQTVEMEETRQQIQGKVLEPEENW